MRKEASRKILLLLIISSLSYCIMIWYEIVKNVLVLIMITLLLLIIFFIIFFVFIYCNIGFCFYFDDCAGCDIVIAWFWCDDNKLKRLSNALSSTLFMSVIRALTCFVKKPGIMIWLFAIIVISSNLLKGSM